MTPAETRQVLSFCGSVDGWMRAADTDAAALMLAGWSDLLGGVPLDVAMNAARTHYSQANARSLQPGDVLAYAHDQRRAHDREQQQAVARELVTTDGQVAMQLGSSGTAYMRDLMDAVAKGHEPPPMPPDLPRLTKAADVWERRCVFHELCACDHTTCRDGWSDAETTVMNGQRKTYPAVQRCAHCGDALLMAIEKGVAKKPSRTASRR